MSGNYRVVISKSAERDKDKIKQHHALRDKADALISILKENPYQNPPPYEKLRGDLSGLNSRRINIQHRLVYQVFEDIKTVRILAMWTHYEQ